MEKAFTDPQKCQIIALIINFLEEQNINTGNLNVNDYAELLYNEKNIPFEIKIFNKNN